MLRLVALQVVLVAVAVVLARETVAGGGVGPVDYAAGAAIVAVLLYGVFRLTLRVRGRA